jgi:hypothetical protein
VARRLERVYFISDDACLLCHASLRTLSAFGDRGTDFIMGEQLLDINTRI